MPPDMALSVGVVGAGIAGLGAAIALRRAGHDVEVFERSSFKNEVGAAITMTSNATRCLNRWGFDYEKARAVECAQIRMPMATDLQMIFQDSFETAEEDYGARMWFFHRVDLHSELRAMAENPDSAKGKLVEIRLGTEVADMDPEDGVLHMADGTRIQKDLLILADGQHSPFLEKITGQTLPMVKTGRSSFRALIPFDKLMADPVTRAQFHNESPGFHVAFMPPHDGKGPVFAVTYPCRDSELLNCAIVHDTRPEDAHKDDWNSPASSAELMDCLKDFNPRLKAIFEKADVVKVYTLMHHAPPDRMVNGRAVVIGDASHPVRFQLSFLGVASCRLSGECITDGNITGRCYQHTRRAALSLSKMRRP